MKQASEYGQHAAECRRLAQNARNEVERQQLLDMADAWARMGSDREQLSTAPLDVVATLIEQRNQIQRSLQESEERFRSTADNMPIMLWMSGTDKLGVFFNQAWLTFTGRTLEQELGEGWVEGVHPDDIQDCLHICRAAFDTQQPFEVEFRLRRHDGEYRWIHDRGTPRYASNNEFLGFIGSAFDISERKRAEESNLALAHVQRLAIIGELTAALAHELKQPLSAILSNAEAARTLLKSPNPPLGELDEILSDIARTDQRANEVLGHIQDFLRKQEPTMLALDLNAAVSDVLRWSRTMHESDAFRSIPNSPQTFRLFSGIEPSSSRC